MRVLNASEAEIANLEIAILVDENVGGLEITVDDTCGVDVFQTTLRRLDCAIVAQRRFKAHQNLVQEVLDELLLEGTRSEETVQIGSEEFSDCVSLETVLEAAQDENERVYLPTYISSSGEMKISLKLMTC